MNTSLATRLDRIVETLPRSYRGPGGAIAALRDGEVLVRHAWGWANAERRIPFTPRSLFRMCSITKQFTCAVVLDAFPDPSVLDGDVRARLPLLEQRAPTRCISATTSPACATTGRWRCCTARLPRPRSATPRPPA